MKRECVIGALFSTVMAFVGGMFAQERMLDQNNPIWQSQYDKQINVLSDIEKLTLDPIKSLAKIICYKGLTFILDKGLSVVSAFSNNGKLLATIGRPGQGPGDFDHPGDMFIANDGTIYVLNSMSRRIEVFDNAGKYRNRIMITPLKNSLYSYPNNILVLPNKDILLSYALSSHILDSYNSDGEYIRELIHREESLNIPGTNTGNASALLLQNNGNIIHFNRFNGIFTLLNARGIKKMEFSAYSKIHADNVQLVQKTKNIESKAPGVHVNEIFQWTNICSDSMNNIYTISLFDIKDGMQNVYVFSPEGTFLYKTTIPYFKNIKITNVYNYEDTFYFVSGNVDIYYSKMGRTS